MFINPKRSPNLIILTLISTLALWRPALNAEPPSKAEAVNRALAQAKTKIEDGQKTKSRTDTDFRQKLWQRITSEKREEERPSELDAVVTFMPSQGAKSQSGKVGLIESEFEYSYELKAFGKLPVEVGIGAVYVGINNSTAVTLPPHLTTFAAGVNIVLPFFKLDKTYLRIGATPSFNTDDWNFDSSAFRIPVNAILIYHPDEKFTGILGVHVTPSSVQKRISAIYGFIYKPNDNLTYNIIGPRPNILYMINKKLGIFGEGKIFDEEFIVNKDNLNNVVLLYKEYLLGGGILYKFHNFAQTSISVGGVFNRYLKYRDEGQNGKVAVKNGLYTEFRTELYW